MLHKSRIAILGITLSITLYIIATIIYTIMGKASLQIHDLFLFPVYGIYITFGLILSFTVVLFSGGLLLITIYKSIFGKNMQYILWVIYGFSFLVIINSLLYGQAVIGNSWLHTKYYIDAFGLYKVYIEQVSFHFFFESIGIKILYTSLLILMSLMLWKGRVKND